jgi:hypothetical protein
MGKNYDNYVVAWENHERAKRGYAEVEGGGTREGFENAKDALQDTHLDLGDALDAYNRDPSD